MDTAVSHPLTAMQGRVTINDLSNEVLWRVVENLRPSPETLAALTLTSHRFCELVKAVFELPIRDLYLLHDYARVTTADDDIRDYIDGWGIDYRDCFESALINHLRWARRAFLRKILRWLEPDLLESELLECRVNGFYDVRIQLMCGRIHFQPYAWEAVEEKSAVLEYQAQEAFEEKSVVLEDQAWELKFNRWQRFATYHYQRVPCQGFTTPWGYTCQPPCDELPKKEDTWPICSVCTCGCGCRDCKTSSTRALVSWYA